MQISNQNLSFIDLSCLRVADGIASAADITRLQDAGIDAEVWKNMSAQLRSVLVDTALEIDISQSVMDAIFADNQVHQPSLSSVLQQVLVDRVGEIDIADNVMEKLSTPNPKIASFLLDPNPPDVLADIMRVICPEEEKDEDVIYLSTSVVSDHDASFDLDLDAILENLGQEDKEISSLETRPQLTIISAQEEEIEEQAEFVLVDDLDDWGELDNEGNIVQTLVGEEDSNEEFCSVDVGVSSNLINRILDEEATVSENMLSEQDPIQHVLQQNLMDKDVVLDIWTSIAPKLQRPPLRVVRETSVEVVEKVPVPETKNPKIHHDTQVLRSVSGKNSKSASDISVVSPKSIDGDAIVSTVSMTLLGSFLAIAAAWLVFVLPNQLQHSEGLITPAVKKEVVAFEVTNENHLQVEELEVASNRSVQILQGDENAPTIIFIEELVDELENIQNVNNQPQQSESL